ncbi:MAG: nitronate monooxygenase [Actinomycetia bacterium]|nr:nitronate monooxygenase [Actinomycetes bacterium]
MGVAVSNWRLARAVSQLGHLGVVSGVAIDAVLVRRLQLGDDGGHMRRALAAFPVPGVGEQIIEKYYVPGGKHGQRLVQMSMKRDKPSRQTEDLGVAAAFAEVFLAKEGHDGLVGVNHLEKVQATTLPMLYGAMLAGVDYVTMGAGIPKTIPAVLDKFAAGQPAELRIDVKGATPEDNFRSRFDPVEMMRGELRPLARPQFLGIVSSHVLATMLATKIEVLVDGFIVEAPTAGGHNAPPRGKLRLDEAGEPIYGERDVPDLDVIRDLGLPFWLAGGRAEPEQIQEALDLGAAGVQVGTAFAYCDESGFEADIKRRVIDLSRQSQAQVFTDPVASPSGFPFKVVTLEGTLSQENVYENRRRICELGYLRSAYRRSDGKMGWRCAAEPVELYVGKGGDEKDTVGRKCLCSALMANVGLPQVQREGDLEPTLVTSGDDVAEVARFVPPGADSFTAADVVRYLLPEG